MQNTYFPKEEDDKDIEDVLKDDDELQEDAQHLQDMKTAKKALAGNIENGNEGNDSNEDNNEVTDNSKQNESSIKMETPEPTPEDKVKLEELRNKGVTAVIDIVAGIGARFRKVPTDKIEEWKESFHANVDGLSVLIIGDDLATLFNKMANKGSPTTRIVVLIGFLILMMFMTPIPTSQGNEINLPTPPAVNLSQATSPAASSIQVNPYPTRFSIYNGRR